MKAVFRRFQSCKKEPLRCNIGIPDVPNSFLPGNGRGIAAAMAVQHIVCQKFSLTA